LQPYPKDLLMRTLLAAIFGSVFSWWGLTVISVLDSSIFFFAPLAIDAAVIILTARSPELFWLYAIIATIGSLFGSAMTYHVGRRIGEAGLTHFVAEVRLKQLREQITNKGAVALALLTLAPPPFPYTALVLVAGALKAVPSRFFLALGPARLLRFGSEAVLAYFYGEQIASWLESNIVKGVGIALFIVMIVGSIITLIRFIRKTRAHRISHSQHAA
jgi:membrane protein YqaA with SNARE-associated domain